MDMSVENHENLGIAVNGLEELLLRGCPVRLINAGKNKEVNIFLSHITPQCPRGLTPLCFKYKLLTLMHLMI